METSFGTNDALTKKVWGAKVIVEAKKDIYFDAVTGDDANNIIQNKMELTKEKGDKVTIPLRVRLVSEGTDTENADLEGSEEEMTFHDFSVSLIEKGHAVKAKNKLSLQRPAFDLRTEFKDGLRDWLAEYIDKATVTALSASPTTNRNIFGGDAAGTDSIDASDTMSVAVIQKARRKARLATPKIFPLVIKGQQRYIMLMHDYQSKALKADDAWKSGQYYAALRGETNPIFTGALGMIDGVVLKEYERCKTYNTWGIGGNLTGARALLLGAQAGVHAFGQLPRWYEKLFDYNRIPGIAVDLIWKAAKTVFDSEDFSAIAVDTYIAED